MRQTTCIRRAMAWLGATAALTAQQPVAHEAPSYDRDIRPILADRCFRCHGPDAGRREADLRLDVAAEAFAARSGAAAIVPGDPDASELWRRITTDDPDDHMPPPDSGRPALDAAERAKVRAWIAAGATYQPHWSFVPPVRPQLPTVGDAAWCRTDVDRFVLARLEARGLSPSPTADPATLLRRLYLVLTGLPPEPADLVAFAADHGDAAWDRAVDRLLQDEPYRSRTAEHLATPWLDAARYADTQGLHTDNGRQMWPWRDWVLRALRDDMPYDRFATEQLAGDLLPDATQDQKIASGFHRCQVTTDEGGAIDEEYLVEYAVERTAVTGTVFLGLTLGCARCHEHKFDPVSQEEFYGLYAYFDSIDQPGLYSQTRDSNRAYEPFLRVPTAAQRERERALQQELDAAVAARDTESPEEVRELQEFEAGLARDHGLRWVPAAVTAARSSGGAVMTVLEDGSVRATGKNPDRDVHELRLRTDGTGLRLLCIEALLDAGHAEGRVGRADNGNAVLQGVEVEAIAAADPTQRQTVDLVWAWATHEQQNRDFGVTGALRTDDDLGWAVAAHETATEPRAALLLSDVPFGYDGGTELVVRLHYDSIYPRHAFGRVRVSVGALADAATAQLPEARSGWYVCGPFDARSRETIYDEVDGPEQANALDRSARFLAPAPVEGGDAPARQWRHEADFRDGRSNELAQGTNRSYVAQTVFAPSARRRPLSLGSDDGFRLFVDGRQVGENKVDRGLAPDQDRVEVDFPRGAHLLVMQVVNTGGNAGFYLRRLPREGVPGGEWDGDLVGALLPPSARAPIAARVRTAFRLQRSPGYADKAARVEQLEQQLAALDAEVARTMVMRELDQRRPTYVLKRGEYDQPDHDRPVHRSVPAVLGALPEDAPDDRRGLAQWLVGKDHPLFARVQVNRLWELLFGAGIVRTSEDFGMQGEWPSHKDLLDWLAIEFRDSGYDQHHVLRLLLRSAVFRQQARARSELRAVDPDDRLLGHYPRRRLSAEQIRDQALFVSGLLVERFGGPSVKPYQPAGLWREVAMPASNTRTFERGSGDDLYRRSLYTYYKRACPPPFLLLFDAPTRETCVVRRLPTSTPQQALALWNDEQLVEAARALAQRAFRDAGDDAARVQAIHQRCTGAVAGPEDLQRLLAALQSFRQRYRGDQAAAEALLAVGMAPRDGSAPAAELAAMTLVASAILNLDATLCVP